MLITYDVQDIQILIVAPATTESDTAFTCEIPDSLVAEYIESRKNFKGAMDALERAINLSSYS